MPVNLFAVIFPVRIALVPSIAPEKVDTPATVRLPIPTSPLTSNEVSVPTFVSEELTTPEPRVVAFSTDVLLIL